MNLLQKFEAKELEKLKSNTKEIPAFSPGDTIRVNVRVKEGAGKDRDGKDNTGKERIQAYEGVCIARADTGINESFTVRKISLNEGIERTFPIHSPRIESIVLVRRGNVRRAKLYYLRDRRGKKARIAERTSGHGLGESEGE